MSAEGYGVGEPKPVERRTRVAWKAALVAACLALAVALLAWVAGASRRTEFPMKLVPIVDDPTSSILGDALQDRPSPEVKQYPQFRSSRPLFGKFFVKRSDVIRKPNAGYFFAIDESKGTGTRYDAFYLDTNRNLDLSDDKPAKGRAPAANASPGEVLFDVIEIPRACDDGSNLAVAPRICGNVGGGMVCFMPEAFVRRGRVRMAGRTYTVTLARRDGSRYDLPSTSIGIFAPELAIRIGGTVLWRWRPREDVSGRLLSTMFPVNGKWCSLTTTASGGTVTVHEYKGDVGAIRASRAGKTGGNPSIVQAILCSDNGTRVSIPSDNGFWTAKFENGGVLIPAGNYIPEVITITMGQVYVIAYRRQDGDGYFLKVRKDKPCILEIESSADILWSGMEAERFMPGGNVSVQLLLATSTLIIQLVNPRPTAPLAPPTIRIEDSAGRILNEGMVQDLYRWTIPADFVPRGGRETLKMTATWDTKELFGVVTGTKEIVVESTEKATP